MKKEKKKKDNLNGDELENKISAILILEVLGRPKEHLVQTLNDLIKKIDEEKGVEVEESKISEPKNVKDKEDLFTAFTEIEINVDNLSYLSMLMFKYMPAHIEVIEPENLKINNNLLGEVMSEIVRRLHRYDELARVMQAKNKMMENQIKKLEEEKKK